MDEASKIGMDLLIIEAKNTLAVALFRQGNYVEAEQYLRAALKLNHVGLQQADQSDLSQPALYGLSLLYLARVALFKNDVLSALTSHQRWRTISTMVENRWVKNLSIEVEHQAMQRCLVEGISGEAESLNFEGQVKLLRKVLIERASRKLGTSKISHIADELQVQRQTIHQWLKDLKKENIPVYIHPGSRGSIAT